jgi:hypothetical protein
MLANYDPVLHTCATSPYMKCNLCCRRHSHNHTLFGLRFFPLYANYTSVAVLQVLVKEQDINKTAISLLILLAQFWFCILLLGSSSTTRLRENFSCTWVYMHG